MTKKKKQNTKTTKPKEELILGADGKPANVKDKSVHVVPTGFSLSSIALKKSSKASSKKHTDEERKLPWDNLEPDECCNERFDKLLTDKKQTSNKLLITIIVILSIALTVLTFS